MRVDIEKRYVDSYKKIVIEANKTRKGILKTKKEKYKKNLFRKDISVENKKKELTKNLHELVMGTFATNTKSLKKIKGSIDLIRDIIHKIKGINNYLEESFLRELGIIKKSLVLKAIKSSKPEKYLERTRIFPKGYVDKIEHTVYEMMQKIVFFDRRLLKQYKKKEVRIVKTEKIGIKDLDNILKIESQLLDALEAKMPPSSKVKQKLLSKDVYNKWIPMVFALLSSFETEYGKEKIIFSKIKKSNQSRKKIENKIKHVVKEKEHILKIKEKRALAMKNLRVSDDYRQTFHEYVSAASL